MIALLYIYNGLGGDPLKSFKLFELIKEKSKEDFTISGFDCRKTPFN